MSSRASSTGGPTRCKAGGRLVLERLHFSAQLTLSLEGGAEILAALAAQRGIFLLPPAPVATPGARGLRVGGRVNRPMVGPESSSLSSLLPRRGLARTCRTIPDS